MIESLSEGDSDSIVNDLKKRIRDRKVVKALQAMRLASGLQHRRLVYNLRESAKSADFFRRQNSQRDTDDE